MIASEHAPSAFERQRIRCECGSSIEGMVAKGLHVSERPELRESILAGELHRFPCADCNRTVLLDTFLPYSDFPRRQLFIVTPSAGLFDCSNWLAIADESFEATMTGAVPEIVRAMGQSMTRRVVFGLASLREKLVLFDAGVDDRLIEILKIQLLRDLGLSIGADDYFHVSDVSASKICFARSEGAGIKEMIVPRLMLDQLAALGAETRSMAPFLYETIAVDHRLLFFPSPDSFNSERTPD